MKQNDWNMINVEPEFQIIFASSTHYFEPAVLPRHLYEADFKIGCNILIEIIKCFSAFEQTIVLFRVRVVM